ncbi:MAG: AI-2E family transporter [Novosphingobium sp.]|nr:AI-2E family transporter [Novosphingobium sp.]
MEQHKSSGFRLEDGGLLGLVILVSLAFAWLVMPFFGAILWGLIAAILCAPVYSDIVVRTGGRRNLAASLTLVLIVALVIFPAILLGVSLVQEAAQLYARLQSGDIDIAKFFIQLQKSLPPWALEMVSSSGLTEFETARDMLGNSVASILQSIASRALWFGQGALQLLAALGIMLYLTFFLLRDGEQLSAKVRRAMPLDAKLRDRLIDHFIVVIRATMRGTVVVAILQGLVGGIIFWLLGIDAAVLWGLLMALFSLVPAVGTGIVWVPVAIYLLATGSILEGVVLVFCGLFVIGLIDNVLRPILVGHEARLPEFVVLIATLAGLNLMGLTGVVVGPIIAALFMAIWTIVGERHNPQNVIEPDTS